MVKRGQRSVYLFTKKIDTSLTRPKAWSRAGPASELLRKSSKSGKHSTVISRMLFVKDSNRESSTRPRSSGVVIYR